MFMVFGAFIALIDAPVFPGHQVAIASPPMHNQTMPHIIQSDLSMSTKKEKDTVIVKDTVYRDKPKYVYVQKRKRTTDTVYVPMPMPGKLESMSVKNISGGREEKPLVESQRTKRSDIKLTVDGKLVYSTENDNHSAEEGR